MGRPVTVQKAVEVLNRALAADQKAIERLFVGRIQCNEALASDPSIQVHAVEKGSWMAGGEGYSVGTLGIINGIFGVNEWSYGAICAKFELECLCDEPMKGLKEGDRCPICGNTVRLGRLVGFLDVDTGGR